MIKKKIWLLSFLMIGNVNGGIFDDLKNFSRSENLVSADVPSNLIDVRSISAFRDVFINAINNQKASNDSKCAYYCGILFSSMMYALIVNDISWVRNVKCDISLHSSKFSVENYLLSEIKDCADDLINNTPYSGDLAYAGMSQPFLPEIRIRIFERLGKINFESHKYLIALKKISEACWYKEIK